MSQPGESPARTASQAASAAVVDRTSAGDCPSPAPPDPSRRASGRLVGLDAVRGGMLLVSVGVDSWVNVPAWFDHAGWIGIHPMDWIFPVFVTLSGCGLAFANARRVRVKPAIRRIVILCVVGLVYNYIISSGAPFRFSTLRYPGVLQLYAGVVTGIVLLHMVLKGWKSWAWATAVMACSYTLLLAAWSAHCGGRLTTSCNPSHVIDYAVFGPGHLYVAGTLGYDPEGVPSILGALVVASMGATIGHLILEYRRRGPVEVALAGGAVLIAALGFAQALDLIVPAFKKQWTPPFDLLLATAAGVLLLAGHLVFDRRRASGTTAPDARFPVWVLVALGRNSLFVYFGSHALTAWLGAHTSGGRPLLVHLEQAIAVGGHPQATLTVALEALWIGLAAVLHWRKIYLRP
ncbi:hypothetical protein K6U06_06170 [Acidiferrimicrobium sp. IK]|uniref:hypothetical protein n=1 Tax=Acidiferrimicrobium sp. IK TaxID=2871700 RepID=UPI0021CB9597|nr:hypothetical protein [Acidiferrimicrobium sp. IK]MCU4183938.1 hypothetical protein [Acidiferrimicrobium sp. IK]